MKRVYQLGFIFLIFSGISLGLTASAEEGLIPSWIKNTALWYGEGQVSDTEFISALQFLINQDVIKIPITEVSAAKVNLSDAERAQSFVVNIISPTGDSQKLYSFSIFSHTVRALPNDSPLQSTGLSILDKPTFSLISLPSEDKKKLYELIGLILDSGKKPARFQVIVDVVSGAGNTIQTWDYRSCYPIEHHMYVEENKDIYRFSETNDSEIREKIIFECIGYSLR